MPLNPSGYEYKRLYVDHECKDHFGSHDKEAKSSSFQTCLQPSDETQDFAYVDFTSEEDMQEALKSHTGVSITFHYKIM